MGKMVKRPSPATQKLRVALKELDGMSTRVGWFESAKYANGTPVAYVAAIQEFGYGPIPPRPFFRPTISAQTPAWQALIAQAAKGVAKGTRSPYQAFDLLGLQAAGDVRAMIASIQSPPLKAATLAARKRRGNGSDKPLVDTRIMLPTLTHITEKT